MHRLSSYLQDTWIEGEGEGATLADATTTAPVATTSTAGLDLGAALAHARDVGGPALRAMTFAERGALLKTLSGIVHAHRDELCELSRENYGATRGDAKFDVDGASGTLSYYAYVAKGLGDRHLLLDGDPEPIGRSKRFVGQHVLVPKQGVAVHINAFNFPAWGMCEKLAVSLLAGVPAIVKPATATALVTWRVVQLWTEAGALPPGAVSLLCGGAGDLLDHLQIQDVVAFTGSSATGAAIRGHAKVVELGIPVNVEADSLNASILGPDTEPGEPTFEMFVRDVVTDLTQKAGQKCTAVRRAFVPTELVDDVKEALTDLLSQAPVGDPADRVHRVGPVSTAQQHRDVQAGVDALASHFDTLTTGTDAPDSGWFVQPRVFVTDQGAKAPYVHEHEVFGPVATVLTYDDVADACATVASGGGGLVCSLYTDDLDVAGSVITALAPWHGRLHWGSAKVADQSPGPGTVLPNLVHGGPGKAGGGEELGGLRGLRFYQQRTAIQADRGLLDRVLGNA